MLLAQCDELAPPRILWSMQYIQRDGVVHADTKSGRDIEDMVRKRTLAFPPLSSDLTLGDSVLSRVQEVWQRVSGPEVGDFMVFSRSDEGQDPNVEQFDD